MHTLIYLSASSHLFNNDEIVSILKVSRMNNTSQNITGLLLYHEGSILQVLEGDRDSVYTLFNKISKDRRHKGIIKTLDTSIQERSFPDWSMGFKEISKYNWEELTGFFDLSNTEKLSGITGSESSHILSLIGSFANVNRLNI